MATEPRQMAAPGARRWAARPALGRTAGTLRDRRVVPFTVLAAVALALLATKGAHGLGQATLNGLTSGGYFALGAVGLTLVYGSLRLINFAHGDYLTFGAFAALLVNVTLDLPLVAAIVAAMALTAALAVGVELVLWRPMRARGAGMLQLILMAIGVAFVVRYGVAFVAGTEPRSLHVDVTSSYSLLGGLVIGRTALYVSLVALLALVVVIVMLRRTRLGKQMRALSDDIDLAETTGIDTRRVILAIWAFAGALAGLAGVLYAASLGSFDPNFGFVLILSLFAAVILGGIGNAYGAVVAGIALGLMQEWSTLLIEPRWKVLVGFALLIGALTARPHGIFGQAPRL